MQTDLLVMQFLHLGEGCALLFERCKHNRQGLSLLIQEGFLLLHEREKQTLLPGGEPSRKERIYEGSRTKESLQKGQVGLMHDLRERWTLSRRTRTSSHRTLDADPALTSVKRQIERG